MKKELLALLICMLFLITSFSGCVEESATAEEVKDMFLQALEEINSYKYSSDGVVTFSSINSSETNTTNGTLTMMGEVDILNKKIKQFNNLTNIEASEETHLITYVSDNVTYVGNKINGNISWQMLPPGDVWNVYSIIESHASYLENGTSEYNNSELKLLSDETFENVDCYVLQFKGNQNQSASDFSVGYQYAELDVKYWISKNDNLLKKCHMESIYDSSGFIGRTLITSEIEMLFYDYNVPLNIVVPDEAKNSSWSFPS